MKTNHSPLPWRAQSRSMSDGALVIKTGSPDYIEVCCIAEKATRQEGPDNDRQMADAALIVRAVNAHAELVAALEEITIAECQACYGTGKEKGRFDDDACTNCGGCGEIIRSGWPEHIRAALASAKGE